MFVYCHLKNDFSGYAKVISFDVVNDRISIDVNGKKRNFVLSIASGRSLFSDESMKKNIDMIINNYTILEKLHDYLIKQYSFAGFCHETTMDNMASIIESQNLYSRFEMQKRYFVDIANQEIIEKTDIDVTKYARLYFYKKTPTNYRFEEKNNCLVYLVFEWDISYLQNAIFCNGNAASMYTKKISFMDLAKNIKSFSWNVIFSRGSINCSEEDKIDIIRIRNAELLVPKSLSTSYLKYVIFQSKEDVDLFCSRYLTIYDIIKEKIRVDYSYFNGENVCL